MPVKADLRRLRFLVTCGLLLGLLAGCSSLDSLRRSAVPPGVLEGAALLKKGDLPKATAKFDAALKEQPSEPALYQQIAGVCEQAQQWDLTARYAERGLAATRNADPRDRAELYTLLGMARMKLNQMPAAIVAHKAARDLLPNDPNYLNNLGYAYAEAGTNLDEAVSLTQAAVSMAREQGAGDEEMGIYMDSLGWAYYKRGSYTDAAATLARAAEMAPGTAEIHYHLAMAYEKVQRIPEAIIHLERAIKINPQLDAAQRELTALKATSTPPPGP